MRTQKKIANQRHWPAGTFICHLSSPPLGPSPSLDSYSLVNAIITYYIGIFSQLFHWECIFALFARRESSLGMGVNQPIFS